MTKNFPGVKPVIKKDPIPPLNAKIVSKEEAFWTELKEKIENDVLNMQRQIMMNEVVIDFVKKKIAAEQKDLNTC